MWRGGHPFSFAGLYISRFIASQLSVFMSYCGLIVTYAAFQSGWKESHSHFLMELKNLQACGVCTFGQSLKAALDLLNSPRLHTGIDNYGQASLNCALCTRH